MGIPRRTFVPGLKARPFYIKITRTNPTRFAWRELYERVASKRARFLFRPGNFSGRSQRAVDTSPMAKLWNGSFGGKFILWEFERKNFPGPNGGGGLMGAARATVGERNRLLSCLWVALFLFHVLRFNCIQLRLLTNEKRLSFMWF